LRFNDFGDTFAGMINKRVFRSLDFFSAI
jgi:hypothetical protein